jgi:hypothetical protein
MGHCWCCVIDPTVAYPAQRTHPLHLPEPQWHRVLLAVGFVLSP